MSPHRTIKERREALGFTQPALAALAGCKQQDIYRLENPGPKGTRHSKYTAAIMSALGQAEAARNPNAPQISESAQGLSPSEVQAALEVLFRSLSKTDKAAQWAAETVLQVLQSREPPPYGMDRAARVRSKVHDIAAGLSAQEH